MDEPIASDRSRPGDQASQQRTGGSGAPAFRILVVDDNRDSADSLAMLLAMMGHQVRTAHDGLEAVRAAEEFRPEVALLDIGLPGLNGYDAAQRIREQPWGAGVVLIAVSGWGQVEDKHRSREAGFDHHLVKPVDLAALLELLATLERGAPDQERLSL